MAKILNKKCLAPQVYEFLIEAPLIAHKCQPGQFIIIRVDENSERIPLTIGDFDRENGTITLVVQAVGNTTKHLCNDFVVGDDILDSVGPLDHPSEMKNFGTVVCIGGGIGVAPIYPIARAYKALGNKIISIIGGRNKDLVMWKEKMMAISDELIITTDDGSEGHKGFVTDPLKAMLEKGELPDLVLAIGPVIMMKNVVKKNQKIPFLFMLMLLACMSASAQFSACCANRPKTAASKSATFCSPATNKWRRVIASMGRKPRWC